MSKEEPNDPKTESESSLPSQPAHIWRLQSSPPLFHSASSRIMEQNPYPKSEPLDPTQANAQQLFRPPSSAETERPASAQRINPEGANRSVRSVSSDDADSESDPGTKIADFDWEALEHRYHDAMRQCEENELQLMQEWENLMIFFKIWAESGHAQETERTYSRLRTRMVHVQNSEDSLEKKRAHYINVVKAFESAMNLLQTQFG